MTIDRLVFGMHHLAISQAGAGYGKQYASSVTHTGFELDLFGEDRGVDYWRNLMPNTWWLCTGAFGTKATGNTRFFWPCDQSGARKRVQLADGSQDFVTLAMTHSGADFAIGKLYGYQSVMYQEGTAGHASGNHIHLEVARGLTCRKVPNVKGFYNLPAMMDARKAFFILDGYTTVVADLGLKFKHCSEVPVKPKPAGGTKKVLFVPKKCGANIRKALTFKEGRNVADIVGFIPVNAEATVLHLTQRFEADGYEWAQVEYNGVSGFVQLDTKAYLLKGAKL